MLVMRTQKDMGKLELVPDFCREFFPRLRAQADVSDEDMDKLRRRAAKMMYKNVSDALELDVPSVASE